MRTQLRVFRPERTPSSVDQHDASFESSDVTVESDMIEEHLLGQFIPLHYHFNMLQDRERVGAFARAIQASIEPGMHVVELGGGTGILSSFAARAGATVTCVERNAELVENANRFIRLNELEKQIRVIHADACSFVPDQPVDAVICEMLHVGLLREKQTQVIESFKKNYVAKFDTPLPRFLPEASVLSVQPVQQCFDFEGYYAPVPLFQPPVDSVDGTQPLAPLSIYSSFCYDERIPHDFDVMVKSEIQSGGMLNAIRLYTQNLIRIDPAAGNAITWPNQFLVLPLEHPQQVRSGDTVEFTFQYSAGDPIDHLSRTLHVGVQPSLNRLQQAA